ncbi:MAG: hypothetical protein GKS01_15015 [Alphaproteobacteria bacterium]|nr:hypothetical protein [Alphaproteobacteria bacterium]
MSGFKSDAFKGADTIKYEEPRRVAATGILHFTIGVTDLEVSRKFYEEVVGCTYWRQNDTTVFMKAGEDYFVLSRTGYHQPPNKPQDSLIHHAFMVDGADFDAAMSHLEDQDVEILLYEDTGHRSFSGRHAYFHDPDGNGIEIIDFQGVGDISAEAYQGRQRRLPKSHLSGE